MIENLGSNNTLIPPVDAVAANPVANQEKVKAVNTLIPPVDAVAINPVANQEKVKAVDGSLLGTENSKDETTYQDFHFPEGIEKDEEFLNSFKGIAKNLGLNQEQAQKLIDLQTTNVLAMHKKQEAEFLKVREDMQKETIDKLGKDYKEKLSIGKAGLKKILGDEAKDLFEFLDVSGLGNHYQFVNVAIKIGELLQDDKLVVGGEAKNRVPKNLTEAYGLKI